MKYFFAVVFAILLIREIWERWHFEKQEKAFREPDYISLYRKYNNLRLLVFALGLIYELFDR